MSGRTAPTAGLPSVKMAPTYDCRNRFRLTRPTKKFFSSTIERSPSRRSPVRTSSTPMSVRPTVPVSLTPASIGTSLPDSRPICRLKNGNTSAPVAGMPPGDIRAGAGEAEHAGAFQEERAFLGKQQREPRQVDLARIDFCFAEVGVERAGQLQAGCDVVEQVQARLAAGIVRPALAECSQRPARNGRRSRPMPWVSPSRLVICPASDTCRNWCLETRARPAVVFELPVDAAGKVVLAFLRLSVALYWHGRGFKKICDMHCHVLTADNPLPHC